MAFTLKVNSLKMDFLVGLNFELGILFAGEESAGERSLVMVMGGTYLLLAMLILLVVSKLTLIRH